MSSVLRTREALRAVRLDHVLFANAIAKKEFTFLPDTARGSARGFDLHSLLPLWIFARLTEHRRGHERERFTAKEAGKIADRIGYAAAQFPEANYIVVLTHMDGLIRAHPLDQIGSLSKCIAQDSSNEARLRDARVWDLKNIREHLQREIDPLLALAGPG